MHYRPFFYETTSLERTLGNVRQCSGTTRRGKRCRRPAKAGSDLCGLHDGSGKAPGAPKGNRNAVTHGFYSQFYTAEELEDLASAAVAGDLSDEIALLRVRIRRALEEGVELSVISGALGRLQQLMKAQRVISGDAMSEFEQAMADVLAELTEELGLGLGGAG